MIVEPVILEGACVRLEPLTLVHTPALSEIGLDPRLWEWTTTELRTPEDMDEYVRTALEEQDNGRSLPFATVERATGRVVGSTRFGNIDRDNRKVEIGWTWIAPAWQRTAVNTEAKFLMLRHAFEALGCVRVELKTDSLNARSRAAILRIGAREEGVLRNHMITHTGRRRHTVYFSILDTEWPDVSTRLRARLEPGDEPL